MPGEGQGLQRAGDDALSRHEVAIGQEIHQAIKVGLAIRP